MISPDTIISGLGMNPPHQKKKSLARVNWVIQACGTAGCFFGLRNGWRSWLYLGAHKSTYFGVSYNPSEIHVFSAIYWGNYIIQVPKMEESSPI